jgi:hypothetical protein
MKGRILAGFGVGLAIALSAAGIALVAGCETAETDENAVVLVVSPQTVDIVGGQATSVIFTCTAEPFTDTGSTTSTVGNVFLPLRWTVSDESLGAIAGAAGNQALYTNVPATVGQNIVIVRDQAGSEGMAVVNQKP